MFSGPHLQQRQMTHVLLPSLLDHCASMCTAGSDATKSAASINFRHARHRLHQKRRSRGHGVVAAASAAAGSKWQGKRQQPAQRQQPAGMQPGQTVELECDTLAFGGQVGATECSPLKEHTILSAARFLELARQSVQTPSFLLALPFCMPAFECMLASVQMCNRTPVCLSQGVCRVAGDEQSPEVAQLRGLVVLTHGAVPGERLTARIHSVQKGVLGDMDHSEQLHGSVVRLMQHTQLQHPVGYSTRCWAERGKQVRPPLQQSVDTARHAQATPSPGRSPRCGRRRIRRSRRARTSAPAAAASTRTCSMARSWPRSRLRWVGIVTDQKPQALTWPCSSY